ncbi:hypothetical protein Tco_1413371 [Tanacetum coccineum]
MSITKEQQQALDVALIPREQRLRIGNCNNRLSTTFNPKEPTFQVALDVLSLIPFYQAFLISASVPAIYMHEFWATIYPNLPGQKFEDPPFEEEILAFIRELGYPGDIKSLYDVKVDTLYQPWRTFGTIIKKCLSDKATGLDQLRLSRAQIIWGMYNQKKYGDILPDTLTNQAMKESDAYKTYHDFATGKVILKPKYVRRSTREKNDQALTASPGKRLKATAKVAKSGKKKPPAQGLETLSEIALSEAQQMKIVTKRSKTQFHCSHASSSGVDEGTDTSDEDNDDEVNMSENDDNEDDDNADNEYDDGQDDDNEQTESDNDGDDFVHPKFSTHDEEERQD